VIGEIVALFVLFAGVTILGVVAWRLTLQLVGVQPQELAMWKARVREWRTPETEAVIGGVVPPAPADRPDAAARVERILGLLDKD
jgi:hypothetical protein